CATTTNNPPHGPGTCDRKAEDVRTRGIRMEMARRYGTHSTRFISLVSAFNFPFRNIEPDDKILILTDDAMDPFVWQAAMANLRMRSADPVLALYARRDYHCADPSPLAVTAARDAELVIALTT